MKKDMPVVERISREKWTYFNTQYDNSRHQLIFLEKQVLSPFKFLNDLYWIELSRVVRFMNQARLAAPPEARHEAELRARELNTFTQWLSDYIKLKKNGLPLKGTRWRMDRLMRDKKLAFYLWCTIRAYFHNTEKSPDEILSVLNDKRKGEPKLWERIVTLTTRPIQWDAGGGDGCGAVEYYMKKFRIESAFTPDQVKILGFLSIIAIAQVVKLAREEYRNHQKSGTKINFNVFFSKTLLEIQSLRIK